MPKKFHDRWCGETGYMGQRQVRNGAIRWRKQTIQLPAEILAKLDGACEVIVYEEDLDALIFYFAEYPSGTAFAAHWGEEVGRIKDWWK